MKSVGTWENLFCIQDDCRVVEPLSLEMNQLILWNGGSCSFGKTAAPPSHHRRCWVCQKLNAWTSIAATSSLASRKRESFLCIDDFEFASNQTVDFVAGFCELSGFQGRSSNIGANLGTEMSGTNWYHTLDIFGWDGEAGSGAKRSVFDLRAVTYDSGRCQAGSKHEQNMVMKHKRLTKTEQVVPYLQDFPFPYYVVVQDNSR